MDAWWRRRLSIFATHFVSWKVRPSSHPFRRYRTESRPYRIGPGVHVQGMVMSGRSPEALTTFHRINIPPTKPHARLSSPFKPPIRGDNKHLDVTRLVTSFSRVRLQRNASGEVRRRKTRGTLKTNRVPLTTQICGDFFALARPHTVL